MTKSGITIKALADLIFAFIFAFALCSAVQAQSRVFVSGVGLDANPCTRTAPCRTFQKGHDTVAAGGEVIALESAGYGAVTIIKSVTITGEGVVAGMIASPSGNAITIATAGITVNLRSLNIEGNGSGSNGINVTSVGNLHVEGCVISGFSIRGIFVDLAADGSYIFVKDTIVRNNDVGVQITTSTGTVRASIDNCRSERNTFQGFFASSNSRVTINRSVASGNGNHGFLAVSVGAGTTAELSCEECVSSNNDGDGFVVGAGSGGVATVRVSRSTATNNSVFGFAQGGAGVFESLNNNLVRGNTLGDTDGTITLIPTH